MFSSDTALRITLKGTTKGAFILSQADFGESNALPYRIEIIDKTVSQPDISALEKENTLKGLFYRLACEKSESSQNDEEKANYLAEQAIMITDRNPEADLKLRDLLLACQNNEKQCNTIVYSDGIKDTYNRDGNVNVSKNGVSYTMQISNKEEKTEEKVIKKSPKEELVENLAKIHPKVENVKDNTKQSIDMVQIMQKSNQGR
jgi:hypothetical protein